MRVLSRDAEREREQFEAEPGSLEAWKADVTRPETLRGAADGCDAALHLVGVIEESRPDSTYRRVNVEGTRHVVAELERAAVPRLVHVSSLHAERRSSEFQRSKWESEQIVQGFRGSWTVLRPGGVYGPGDQVVTLLLRLVRGSPVVPMLGRGRQPWQPIWYVDLAEALVRALERDDLGGRVLLVAGPEVTTTRDLVERFCKLTQRRVHIMPLFAPAAELGSLLVERLGFQRPLNTAKIAMLSEGNFIERPEDNALPWLLERAPIGLEQGLHELVNALPGQPPEEGWGRLHYKKFEAEADGVTLSAPELMDRFKAEWLDVFPIDFEVEPGASRRLELGHTLTAELPGRGHIQMRVVQCDDTHVTLLTVRGHPIAGVVRLSTTEREGRPVFRVEVFSRASTLIDYLGLSSIGRALQAAQWTTVATRGARLSGAEHVHFRKVSRVLRGAERQRVNDWFIHLDREVRPLRVPPSARALEQPA